MSSPTGNIGTLIVEDEPRTARAHRLYVERLDGFVVRGTAGTGSEAIRIMRKDLAEGTRIDLLLLDISLPDMSGIQLCRSIRAAGLLTDIVAITAARDVRTVREAASLGVVQYLIKPFTFATFAEKLSQYRAYRAGMEDDVPVPDQRHVDAVLASRHPRPTSLSVPKGLNATTLDEVREALRELPVEEGISATELARSLNMARATARRYLDYLATCGHSDRRIRYGGRGRPQHEFRLFRGVGDGPE